MLLANNLTITYSSNLFNNLSFTLGNKEKVGLVGLNGTGKTTLLRIIAGIEIPDSGKLDISKNEHIEYLPQEYSFPENILVGEILESMVIDPKSEMYKVNKILNKLNLIDIDFYADINTLSEGQKMKLYLAKLLINEPTILLLDEPTNHLDINGIRWLEDFIHSFEGICIIVSHDRVFLNNVIDTVFEIDEQKLNIFHGNYDDYLVQKANLIEKREIIYLNQERKRVQMEQLLEGARKITDGRKRSKAVSSAKKRMEREVVRNEISQYKEQKIQDINIAGFNYDSKLIIKIKDLNFSYGSKNVIKNSNFEMFGKEKVWFLGPNGIGKTTLVKLIIGKLTPVSGLIQIGDNLKWAYFSQDQSHLNMDQSVEDYFFFNTDISYNQSFGVMEKFLFTKDMRRVKIGKLSPGQRARLSFAVFSLKKYDFMILDEPTNHIDIKSKEVIEESLKNYQGAIFVVSHDRYFVRGLNISRAITLKHGQIEEIRNVEGEY